MKIYYVANLYMPFEKAYGILLAKTCEALLEEGADLTLVLPRRGPGGSLRDFYGLRVDIPTVWLSSLDFAQYHRFGYLCMSLSFSVSYTLFLWKKYLQGERFIIYTIDADRYSSSALALVRAPIFSEMHGGKRRTLSTRLLFSRLRGVVAVNSVIAEELQNTFSRSPARYLTEPNGVDLDVFSPRDKSQARRDLGLPQSVPIVVYAGRFYGWKGLEIIREAAVEAPDVHFYMVGGTAEVFSSLVEGSIPPNLHCVGGKPHDEVPAWIGAADAVLVLGTKRDEQSYRWTSPMKLFEYLPSGRPIIASATPAIRAAVTSREVLLYEPDSAEDLVRNVREAIKGSGAIDARIAQAIKMAHTHSWNARARRVLHFMESVLRPRF